MDIVQLYQDFNIDYRTEGHKHARPGWVNVECPFCITDNPGYHLGFEITTNHFSCWKCGFHNAPFTISKLLKVPQKEAIEILKQYGSFVTTIKSEPIVPLRIKSFKLPSNSNELKQIHRKYLEGRNFDPDKIIRDFGILGTTVFSQLSTGEKENKKIINYKFRIIIPFFWNDKMVSFDSRDITGEHISKYLACPKDREKIPHKSILYGIQKAWADTCIVVEGPTDVWRFGKYAGATSGIKYTNEQVKVLSKFKRVPVCFDGQEQQARIQATALVAELKFRKVDAFRVDITGDPGNMNQEEADYLVKQLKR